MLLLTYQPQPKPSAKPTREDASQRKLEILEAIGEHLRVQGRKDWDLVRERPEFATYVGRQAGEAGRRKFFRWVREVVSATPDDITRPHEARAAAEKHMAWSKSQAAAAEAEHPDIGVPAAYIAKMGVDGRRRIDTEALARQTLEDLGRLRQEAFLKDATAPGGERVKDVALLERSIRMTTKFLDTYERVGERLWTFENNELFLDVVLDIVMRDVPEEKRLATMKRIKKFQDTRAQLGDPFDRVRMSLDG